MRENSRRVLAVAVGATLFVGLLSGLLPSGATAAPTPPNPTDQQLNASRQQVAAASTQVGVINGKLAAAQSALAAAQVQTEVAIEAYDTAVYQQGVAQAGYTAAAAALKTAQAAVAAQRSQINHLVAATYMTGGPDTAALLMTGGNMSNYGHELAVLNIVSGDQSNALARMQQAQGRQQEMANAATVALRASQAAANAAASAKRAAITAIGQRQQQSTAIQAQQVVLNQQLVAAQRTAGLLTDARAAAVARARAAAAAAAAAANDNRPPSRSGGGGGGSNSGGRSSGSISGDRRVIINAAMNQLGMPYVWAAANPSVGFDCSGLSLYAYKKVGIYLPHSAHLQYDLGTPISRGQLQPGDLVFWSYGSSWTSIHHVAIWAGNGKIIEAADFGIPVHKRSMYWGGYFGAVRLL